LTKLALSGIAFVALLTYRGIFSQVIQNATEILLNEIDLTEDCPRNFTGS